MTEAINIPKGEKRVLEFVQSDPFWNGVNSFGKPKYGWKVKADGQETALFVTERLNNDIKYHIGKFHNTLEISHGEKDGYECYFTKPIIND